MNYAKRVREMMKRSGMNAAQVSKAAGTSKNTVTQWLSGKVEPSLGALRDVCDVWGITLSEFFYEPSENGLKANRMALLECSDQLPEEVVDNFVAMMKVAVKLYRQS